MYTVYTNVSVGIRGKIHKVVGTNMGKLNSTYSNTVYMTFNVSYQFHIWEQLVVTRTYKIPDGDS